MNINLFTANNKVYLVLSESAGMVEMDKQTAMKLGHELLFRAYSVGAKDARLTKRALDGAKAPRKSKRSTGTPRK